MGHKIFVSYKYADYSVKNLNAYTNSKVRDYVTELENLLKNEMPFEENMCLVRK